MDLRVVLLHPDAVLPQYAYPGDAGADLSIIGSHWLEPNEGKDLPTGIKIEAPVGFWTRIVGRSSTLRKRSLWVNEGIIDNGYRGELFVYVRNVSASAVRIERGARLAQIILAPIVRPEIVAVDALSESARGTNGFGSSGTTTMRPR